MPNLDLVHKKDLSSFRRIAIGTWRTAYDPSVYGTLVLRVEPVLEYIEAFRKRTGRRLTLTHILAKVAAACFQELPDANAILRFNRIYQRKRIGVFFQVAMTDPVSGELDLSGITLFDVGQKSLLELVDEFERRVELVRKAKDPDLEKTRSTFKRVPSLLLNKVIQGISLLSYTLNLNMKWAGIPRDAFGSVMITNIGSLGLDEAFAPLVPYSKVPIVIAVGSIQDQPVVEDGKIVPGKVVRLGATFDHRVLDGSHASVMSRVIREWFADPFGHFDEIESLPERE